MNLREKLHEPDWLWGTSEGAELHTLLMGLESTFREKIEWLEQAEKVSIMFRIPRRDEKKTNE